MVRKLPENTGKALWIVNQYAITPDLPGHARHYDLGLELVKQGWDVTVFASDVNLALRKHVKLEPGELWREEVVGGVRFIWIRTSLYDRNDWRRAWNLLTFVINFIRVESTQQSNPHVIIGSSPHLFAPLGAWAVARRRRARFVLELRDLWPQALIDLTGSSEKRLFVRLLRIIEAFLYRKASKIVVLAIGSISYLTKRGVAEDQILYVPNGVHIRNFQLNGSANPEQRRLQSRADLGFDRFTIVYAGAHGPANALRTILKAASLVESSGHNVDFVLVGDGPSKVELIRECKSMGLNNVRFMDPIPKSDIPDLLDAADAAVITLRLADVFSYAISPNKLFDYMAAAKPILCAIQGDMADLIARTGSGLAVPPENPEALAQAVVQLIGLPEEERDAMGSRGRALVQQDFSREALARLLGEALMPRL